MAVVTDRHERLYSITVDQFDRMVEAGVFALSTRDVRVELLDGVVFEAESEGPPHALVVSRLVRWAARGLPESDEFIVRGGSPVRLPPWSQPCPDLAVVDAGDATWTSHPGRAHLVIEVSQTSLRRDRVRKARIYAEAGLPRYWVFDLVHREVIVHGSPGADGYADVETLPPSGLLDPGVCGLPPLDLGALFAAD